MTKKFAWKVLKKGMKSHKGNIKWKTGKWKEYKGDVRICHFGLHASKLLVDAIQFVTPGIICLIEYDDIIEENDNKFVCRKMRVVKTFRFTKRMAVEFRVFCARICLKNFENESPDDKRPRLAIEAAEAWLKNPSKKNQSAANSAVASAGGSAAWLAWLTAAWSAVGLARSAVGLARSAGWAAAESAGWSVAESAGRAVAESAAESAAKKKMERKLHKIIGYKK